MNSVAHRSISKRRSSVRGKNRALEKAARLHSTPRTNLLLLTKRTTERQRGHISRLPTFVTRRHLMYLRSPAQARTIRLLLYSILARRDMNTQSSDYLLIFRESTPERYAAMSVEQRREALRDWNAWCDQLAAEGKLKSGHPLHSQGRIVAGTREKRVLDGPFAEAKEMIGGYFLLAASDLDEATAIAEQSPNLKYGMTVEVRPVAGGCHLARSLGLQGMRETAPM